MQERQGEAFVIATANDVSALPPELLRKGRFDEVWFVDLPNEEERRSVLEASLRSYKRDPDAIDLEMVSAATDGYTGSEIAALVPDAMFVAFADKARPIHSADLLNAAKTVAPLSRTANTKIDALRAWAVGRARPATAVTATVAGKSARVVDLS
jgi:SpoVK/Ycf46/Vps4 family AAA+-type ATPase